MEQQQQPQPQPPPETLTIERRREILQRAIARHVRAGYRLITCTDTTAQMVKPKKFGCLWATLWFLLFGVGLLIYVFYYASKKEQVVYLSVDEFGRVTGTRGKS